MPRLVLARCRYKRNKFVEQIGLKVVGAVKAKSLFKWDRPKFQVGAISCTGKLSYFQSSGGQLTSLSTKSRPSKRQISGELLTVDCSEARKTKEEEVWNHLRGVPFHFPRGVPLHFRVVVSPCTSQDLKIVPTLHALIPQSPSNFTRERPQIHPSWPHPLYFGCEVKHIVGFLQSTNQ